MYVCFCLYLVRAYVMSCGCNSVVDIGVMSDYVFVVVCCVAHRWVRRCLVYCIVIRSSSSSCHKTFLFGKAADF